MTLEPEIISPSDTKVLEAARMERGRFERELSLPHPASCPDGRPLDAALWPAVLERIKPHVNRITFELEFGATRLIDDDGAVLTIAVRGGTTASWLKRRYADLIVDALAACGRANASVKLVDGVAA